MIKMNNKTKRILFLILLSPFIISASCPKKSVTIDKCAACDLYVNIEVKRLCKDTFCPKPTAIPSATVLIPTQSTPTPSFTIAPITPKPTSIVIFNPPTIYFWRGIKQVNASWFYINDQHCAVIDTTIWYKAHMDPSCHGAPSCDTDHFPCMSLTCSGRQWDDPRGPLFYINGSPAVKDGVYSGVSYNRHEYGGQFCAAAGTNVTIDTCPWPDQHACIDLNDYSDYSLDCPHGKIPVRSEGSGCYSVVENVSIQF